MRQEKGVLIIISFLFVTCALLENPNTCVADVATWTDVRANGTFHNGTFLMMPEANVEINITRNEFGCFVNITCLFTIRTNVTQNSTLAFVFPEERFYSIWSDMLISLNGTLANYTVLDWEELGWDLDNITSEYYQDWYTDSCYAVFGTTIQANTTILVGVTAWGEIEEYANYCHLDYIVGSARTFFGDTHQRITVNIIEYVPFLGRQFYPESHLTICTDDLVITATWDFQISEFESDAVSITLQSSEHTPWTIPIPTTTNPGFPDDYPNYVPIGIIAVSVIGLIAIIVLCTVKR